MNNITSQTIEKSTMSGEEKMNWIKFFSSAKADLFIVVLLLPKNQSLFLLAYVKSDKQYEPQCEYIQHIFTALSDIASPCDIGSSIIKMT